MSQRGARRIVYVLFVLMLLFPTGKLISACFGYSFELMSMSVFAFVLAGLSVCAVVFDQYRENLFDKKPIRVLLAMITPISLINAALCTLTCSRIWVVASVWIAVGCCYSLAIQYGKPMILKTISFVFAALIVLPIGFLSFVLLVFGSFGKDTVVQTAVSPHGKYYAQIIDSDDGALGGDTFVDVYEKGKINAIFFIIQKKPKTVYVGEWGEFETMQIHWKDENCLVINAIEYEIE